MASLVTEMEWLGERVRTFRDLIPRRPRALFVGLNPSPVSIEAGHYHQGRLGKRMWRRLEEAGVIRTPPSGQYHDEWLFRLGLGLTDLVKRPSPRGDALTGADLAHGRERLHALLQRIRPRLACFIYKKAAECAIGRRLPSGAGLISDRLHGAEVFVFPGPYSDGRSARRTLARLRGMLSD
jgi:TDG/mug DNA glycosylase family protein